LIGDLTLLPESTRLAAYKLMRETRHGTKCIFNIACPYTSHEEMETAMKLISHAVEVGKLQSDDISQTLMDMSLYTHEPVDIMVRTSGEVRLSDFMLWQVSLDCYIHFINVLWPEFTFWDMLPILLKYQAHHKNSSSNADISERIGEFVRTIRAFRIDKCRLL
jgi:ditrans,polycis-polyprenyl diphosphate synthase